MRKDIVQTKISMLRAKVRFCFQTKKIIYLEKCAALFNSNLGPFCKDLESMLFLFLYVYFAIFKVFETETAWDGVKVRVG